MQNITIVTHGTLLPIAKEAAEKHGVGLINARFLQPLDDALIKELIKNNTRLLVVEENTVSLGEKLALAANPCRVLSIALPVQPIPHATVKRQRERYGLTEEHIEELLQKLSEEA